MKRIIVLLTVIILLLAALSPFIVHATAYEDAVDFQITINTDGSADFIETHTVDFSDGQDYSRYGRIYLYPPERTMDGWFVTVDGKEWGILPEADNENRPDGSFSVEYSDEGAVVTMYHRSTDMQRTFSISYHVENAVNLYDDAAEFFWNLTSDNEISTVKKLTARVTVPEGMNENEFRIWAHGPLNGVFQKDSSEIASLAVSYVTARDPVDIRIVMPHTLFSGGKMIGRNGLEAILSEEQGLADKANAEREEAERISAEYAQREEQWIADHPVQVWINDRLYNISDSIDGDFSGAVFIASIFGIVLFSSALRFINKRKKMKKIERLRQKPDNPPQYYRSLPDHRPPALVGRLADFYGGGNSGNLFTATLMDMTLKGHLAMRKVDGDIILTLLESGVQLLEHEQVICEMIISAKGENPTVTLDRLQSYIKRNAEWAVDKRNNFNASVDSQLDSQVETTLITPEKIPWQNFKILLISSLLGLFILGILISGMDFGVDFAPLLVSMPIGLVIGFIWGIIFIAAKDRSSIKLLSRNDEESMALWQAFGRFIHDFTTFDEKELPEFSVWKEYLVYAVALGKGQKLIHDLALCYPELPKIEDDTYFACLITNGHFDDKLFKSINSIQKETYSARVSTDSSGSGGGGGFSRSGGGSDSGSGGGFAD